jgi:hydroxypyruvate isomerase
VDSPYFGVLYDIYHSAVEGEDMAEVLAEAGALVKYVQLADNPGRGEPGSGNLDWDERLAILRSSGYDGPIGLEYYPTTESSASVRRIVETAARA